MIIGVVTRAIRILSLICYLIVAGLFLVTAYNDGADAFLVGALFLALLIIDFLKLSLIYVISGEIMYDEAWFLLLVLILISSIIETKKNIDKTISFNVKRVKSLTWPQVLKSGWRLLKFAALIVAIAVGIPVIGILIFILVGAIKF